MDELTLDQIRTARNITQAQISQTLGMTQAAVSKLEFRSDTYVSSIRKYIEGLGGRLEMRAIFPDSAFRVRGLDGDGVLDAVRGLLKVPSCEITPLIESAKGKYGVFNNLFYPRRLDPDERYIELDKDNGDGIKIPIRRILAVDPPTTDTGKPILRLQPGACIRWFDEIARWRFDG